MSHQHVIGHMGTGRVGWAWGGVSPL